LARLEEAGAKILPNACGICAGYGAHRLGDEYHLRLVDGT
jgi:3-isopropylmalate/(R)-2-methylmalate dehydratase large subunit